MADPTAFTFDPKEVMTALLKHQGIHDGSWTFGVGLSIAVTNIGKSPEDPQMRPGVVTQIENVTITQLPVPTAGLTFDAAELNPKKK
ncbi:hypothetical protein CH75_09125 [Dyella jiangningensis]|nr:hypothetical protein CH75_09125 [Dyella jiangningensis]